MCAFQEEKEKGEENKCARLHDKWAKRQAAVNNEMKLTKSSSG